MERKFKIAIPEPCHENWDKMAPNENGRFCLSCAKTVIDFTEMLPQEVQHFFIQNQNNKICGRFKKSQLDSIIIQIPTQVLYNQTHYHKMFLLALFIAMGTTLFSCQDKDGNKQKIDKVEVVEEQEHITVGAALPPKNDSNTAVLPPPPPPKINQVKFEKPPVKSNSKKISCSEKIKQETVAQDDIIMMGGAIEIDPEYNGGVEKFYNSFKNNFRLPEEAKEKTGEIKVSFVVEKDGSLEHITPLKDLGFGTMEETIRVLNSSERWQPGTQNGKKIRMRYLLSIQIQKDPVNSENVSAITAINVAKY
jgi:hypothetical protein